MAARIVLLIGLLAVSGHHSLATSALGRLAVDKCGYLPGIDDPVCEVSVYDIATGYSWIVGSGYDAALSSNGTHVAYFEGPGIENPPAEQFGLTVVDLNNASRRTIPQHGGEPAWSYDGRIAFRSYRSGSPELYVINADGSGLRQVTSGIGFDGQPAWSSDGRIAFRCRTGEYQIDICSIRADGTEFTRLTTLGNAVAPAWSADGTRIVIERLTGPMAILGADGSISDLAPHGAHYPTWADATHIAFSSVPSFVFCTPYEPFPCGYLYVYAVNLDGTDLTMITAGDHPSWGPSSGGLPPTPEFNVSCTLLVCTFDGTSSRDDGSIASYLWKFGDGSSASGSRPVHTYAAGGAFTVELTVVDNTGTRGSTTRLLNVTSSPPVASFTIDCRGLACAFDASGSTDQDDGIASYWWVFGDGGSASGRFAGHTYVPGNYQVTLTVRDFAGATDTTSMAISVANLPPVATFNYSCDPFAACSFDGSASHDLDGSVVSRMWLFGDGAEATGSFVTHTYAAAGTYLVSLTVTDNYGTTTTRSSNVSVQRTVLHIGDLDGVKQIQKKTWTASVTVVVHDHEHRPVFASVSGVWSTGMPTSCNPDSSGICTLVAFFPLSASKVTFTVQGVGTSVGTALYDPQRNHDVDGGTNGTSITLTRR